jgi:hypothetical protein
LSPVTQHARNHIGGPGTFPPVLHPQTLCPVECGGAPKTLKSFGKIYAATLQR